MQQERILNSYLLLFLLHVLSPVKYSCSKVQAKFWFELLNMAIIASKGRLLLLILPVLHDHDKLLLTQAKVVTI